ncbi:CopD family protein [Pseudogemmobacter humi]|nr:CopD family protein [Pseudogemmobacter humi]
MGWVKIIHILAVMGWMTSIFAVPRALIYWKREWARLGEFGPLGDLTVRLYRFSAGLMLIAIATGLWLAFGWWGFDPWLHLKITLVVALVAHYLWTGRLVMRARRGEFRESDLFLRIFNEISVVAVIAILWAVVAKPF